MNGKDNTHARDTSDDCRRATMVRRWTFVDDDQALEFIVLHRKAVLNDDANGFGLPQAIQRLAIGNEAYCQGVADGARSVRTINWLIRSRVGERS